MPRPTTMTRLTTKQAADAINTLLAARGSTRRVAPLTLKAWRAERRGPRFYKVSNWFVEYAQEDLEHYVDTQMYAQPGGDPLEESA